MKIDGFYPLKLLHDFKNKWAFFQESYWFQFPSTKLEFFSFGPGTLDPYELEVLNRESCLWVARFSRFPALELSTSSSFCSQTLSFSWLYLPLKNMTSIPGGKLTCCRNSLFSIGYHWGFDLNSRSNFFNQFFSLVIWGAVFV